MKNLLKFEWRKLWRQKSLYVIFSFGFLSIIAIMLLGKLVTDIFNITPNATTYMLTAIASSSLASLLSIYISIFVCSDFHQHTIKNLYARGYSRSAVFFSKYIVSLGVTFAVAILYILFAFVSALILGSYWGDMAGYMWAKLALQFWVLVGLHGLFFGICMMAGKMSSSLVINIVGIGLFFTLLNAIISIFASQFHFTFSIMDYYPETLLTNLVGTAHLTTSELLRVILVPLAYVVVFVSGGWLINQRRDV